MLKFGIKIRDANRTRYVQSITQTPRSGTTIRLIDNTQAGYPPGDSYLDGKYVEFLNSFPDPTKMQALSHGGTLNPVTLSELLGLDWVVASHQPNDVPPGGALVFSLWKLSDGRYSVRIQFVSQTLDQMHKATKLTLQNPPVIVDLFVPGCSTSLEGYPCAWTSFKDLTKRVLAY